MKKMSGQKNMGGTARAEKTPRDGDGFLWGIMRYEQCITPSATPLFVLIRRG